ncbi:MAG: hypothetical protein HY591_03160 [Candidatus Omnitrophica bacterium]|nr:hypothetical protein [Candidatus Omnitrophota bacterium]
MGFRYWYEGVMFVVIFGALVLVPCFFIAWIGCEMANALGNSPTKSARIQTDACWKVFIIEMVSFFFIAICFHLVN